MTHFSHDISRALFGTSREGTEAVCGSTDRVSLADEGIPTCPQCAVLWDALQNAGERHRMSQETEIERRFPGWLARRDARRLRS